MEEIKIVAIIFGMVLVVLFLVNILSGAQCRAQYEEYQPAYTLMSGCRIMHDGVLTPTEIVREVNLK